MAKTLRESGWDVDLKPARDAGSPKGYRAVVLGVPLYMFHLHKDAVRFLQSNQAVLSQMPVAVFALGPAGTPGAKDEWAECRSELGKEMAAQAWLSRSRWSCSESFYRKCTPEYTAARIGEIEEVRTWLLSNLGR